MEFDELFLTGVALRLAAAGIGVWNPTGLYTANQLGITIDAVPQQPENVITLSSYGVDDNPLHADSILGLQVRVRREGQDPRSARDTAALIFDNLQGLTETRLPAPPDEDAGAWVVLCVRRSQVSGGQDANKRWSQIQNFYATVHRPSTHRV